jgi:hypothetical protein
MSARLAAAFTTCQIAWCDSIAPHLIQATYSAEDRPVGDGSRQSTHRRRVSSA